MVSFMHVVYLTLFYVNIYGIAMYTVAISVCYVYASWVYDLIIEYKLETKWGEITGLKDLRLAECTCIGIYRSD